MKNKVLIITVLVLVLLLAGAAVMYNALKDNFSGENIAQTSNPAPDFTVEDSEGNKVKLSDFKGKSVVINFWASWCGPCKSEMPEFQAAYENYGDEIAFLMVNMTDGAQETKDSAKVFIDKSGYSFPVYYDTMLSAATKYKVYSIPATYFVDKNGNLIASARGAISAETLEKGIGMIKE